jgi:hypothetical protein
MNLDALPSRQELDVATPDDAEVARLLDAYLARLEAGESPDPGSVLARFPTWPTSFAPTWP